MHILAINAAHRPNKTTTQLAWAALQGAAETGASTEMIQLAEMDIQFCTNCLTCYSNLEDDIGPCVLQDDVRAILERIREADAILLASPVHNGFVSGRMVAFMERAVWTLCTPTGEIMGLKGLPLPRLTNKARASALLLNAGGVPAEMRQYCDLGTPWLREQAPMIFNGEFVADMFAGAEYPAPLEELEWTRAYKLRRLSDEQLQQAAELGRTLGRAALAGVKPFDPNMLLPPEESC